MKRNRRELAATLSNVNVLAAVLAAVIGGGLAILGGYAAGCQSARAERELRAEERRIASLGAARLLDFELFVRARLLLNSFGYAHPSGNLERKTVSDAWSCAARMLASRSPAETCGLRPVPPLTPDDPVSPIDWAVEDRRLIASRVPGDRWFTITTATERWAELAARHRNVAGLVRTREKALADTLAAITRAREALAPYVRRK